tara:strand:+ start:2571 stop:2963 length:393 start_codon:yes stop_codon:yes gene_type:complete
MRSLFTLIFITFSIALFGQEFKIYERNDVFDIVDELPKFKEGIVDLYTYLGNNVRYPSKANKNNIEGKVFVGFIVWKDGTLKEIKVVKSVHKTLDREAIRLIKSMPKWNPGIKNGYLVNSRFTVPIKFRL